MGIGATILRVISALFDCIIAIRLSSNKSNEEAKNLRNNNAVDAIRAGVLDKPNTPKG
jgi:hypothetical protein